MSKLRLKIGELAERTGVTVRTLRYYDEIGLLNPADRHSSGYRVYGKKEIEQLQKIVSLKKIGLQLDEIRSCLKDPDYNLERVVFRQLKQVRTEIEILKELYYKLELLAGKIDKSRQISADDLIQIIKMTTMFEKYYTNEQLEKLEQRRRALGDDRIREVQEEWKDLIREVRSHMKRGTDPKSPELQKLADRWEELIGMFTGGDPEIRKSLEKMYEKEGPQKASRGLMDERLSKYIGRALTVRGKE